jgi:hypothetical protein
MSAIIAMASFAWNTSHQYSFATSDPAIFHRLELNDNIGSQTIDTYHVGTPGPNFCLSPDTQLKLDWAALIGKRAAEKY